jgi:hypothetical protein
MAEEDVLSVLKSCQSTSNLWSHEFGLAIAEIERLRRELAGYQESVRRIEEYGH